MIHGRLPLQNDTSLIKNLRKLKKITKTKTSKMKIEDDYFWEIMEEESPSTLQNVLFFLGIIIVVSFVCMLILFAVSN
jgi:hypothetical protein